MSAAKDAARLIGSCCSAAVGPEGSCLAAALRDSGLLAACDTLAHHPQNPAELLAALIEIGRADLSAGRLFEGHVNAVKLLKLHDGPVAAVRAGLLHGIWGADGPNPVRIENERLRGQKLFASGADVLDRIIITAKEGDTVRLLLWSREQLQGRLFPEEWHVSGMRATASGRCDFEGLLVADAVSLGSHNSYLQEPHFHGGVWRYAAVQLGAMQALTRIVAQHLEKRGHEGSPLQAMRLQRMIVACETAFLWLRHAAMTVETPTASATDAETAILARLKTAEEAVTLLTVMDEAMGAASFACAHPAERIRRDLGFYLRQANPDGLALGSVSRILTHPQLRERWIR